MYTFRGQIRQDWQKTKTCRKAEKRKKEGRGGGCLEIESALVFIYLERIAISSGFGGHAFIFLLLGIGGKRKK